MRPTRPTSSYTRLLQLVIIAGVALVAVVAMGGLGLFVLRHDALLSVQTASMVPTLRPGDAIVVRRTQPAEVVPGDIISYRNPQNTSMIITHRLVGKKAQTGEFITQGDNTEVSDPAFPAQQLIGEAVAVMPGAGHLLDYVHTPRGLITFVYLPAFLVISFEVRRIVKRLRGLPYQVVDYPRRSHGV